MFAVKALEISRSSKFEKTKKWFLISL